MSAENIDQIYTNNPITTNASTDLMYFGQSPYGPTDDAAMTYANFAAQFGAPYTPAALTKTNDTNVTLTLGGTPTTALLHATSLTLGWTGQLALTRGGTNASLTATAGGIAFSTASALALSAAGSTGQLFQSAGTGTPTWTTATYPSAAGTTGNVLTSDGTNWISSAPSGGSAAGSSQDIQFNSGGAFAADTGNFGWISATHSLYAGSSAEVSAGVQCGFALGLSATVLANHGIALGYGATVESAWGFASGYNAQSNHQGSYVFADSTNSGKSDTANNQWVSSFTGGYFVYTGTTLSLTTSTAGNVSLLGTAAADSASAGYVGEFVTATKNVAGGVSLTQTTAVNVISISLTAGDWDVYGNVFFTAPGTSNTASILQCWISLTSATQPDNSLTNQLYGNTSTFISCGIDAPRIRVNVSTTTTVYLSAYVNDSTQTRTGSGTLSARRVR